VDPTPTFGTATHNIVEIGRETFGVYGKPAALGEDGFGVWGPGTQYETWPEADQDLGRTARRNLNPGVDLGGVGPFAP
jgi:hypothetical protein